MKSIFKRTAQMFTKGYLVIGFAILCVGGAGYNAQLKFIEHATFERVSPCKDLQLGQDCHRPVLFQDILSLVPSEARPHMQGIYRSQYNPDHVIVNYGWMTPLPYFLMMALGALTMFIVIRKLPKSE